MKKWIDIDSILPLLMIFCLFFTLLITLWYSQKLLYINYEITRKVVFGN